MLVLRKLGKEQFLGIPLISKNKTGVFYIPLQYGNGNGSACISQVRVFSMQRLLRKIGKASTDDFKIITKQLSKLIDTGRI